ncbi:hypothetical protein ACFW04_013784 [Cataglyphis niger]
MFLTIVSRPDIVYSVSGVSKYLNNYNGSHWIAAKHIIKYLKGTIDVGIYANYANDIETRKSTTGYVFILAGRPVTWSSQRQKLVTLSTTEAENVATATAAKEIVWLRKLLNDIGCQCFNATELFVDNQSAIRLVKNLEFHKRMKHINICYHFIKERTENHEIFVKFVSSDFQLADIFTKALLRDRFKTLCSELSIIKNQME